MKRFLSLAFLFTLVNILFSGVAFAEEKTVNANVSVDIGANITHLVQNLAAQIGTTADKVFPWYVTQAHLLGVTGVSTFAFMSIIGVSLVSLGLYYFNKHKYSNDYDGDSFKKKGNKTQENMGIWMFVVGIIFSFFCGMYAIFGGLSKDVTCILNPNYHAMSMMTSDMAKLSGKK